MIKSRLTDIETGKSLRVLNMPSGKKTLGVGTEAMSDGVFKVIGRTTAGTSVVCSPTGDGSIVVTDLIATGEKKAGTLILEFSDNTNKEVMANFALTDAPLSFGISFNGRWQGWQGAWLEMITSIAAIVTVSVGYYKAGKEQSLKYNDWNLRR